jgi:hypothetical protein
MEQISSLNSNFLFPSKDRWLQYFKRMELPGILIDLRGPNYEENENDILISKHLVSKCVDNNVSVIQVTYDESFNAHGGVLTIKQPGMVEEKITSDEFLTRFINGSGSTVKPINRKSASAYHDFQRSNFGTNIAIPDIDCIRLIDNNLDFEIIEIKRSFFESEKWFDMRYFERDDSPNFVALADLTTRINIHGQSILYIKSKKSKFDRINITEFSEFGYFPITSARLRNVRINVESIYYGQLRDLTGW